MTLRIATATLLAVCIAPAVADDRSEFNHRAAQADAAAFRQLDLDRDGKLTPEEVRHDLNFGPRFNDADINRDGIITPDEMRRYLEQTYGVPAAKNILYNK